MADQVLTREVLTVTTTNVSEDDKKLGAEISRLQWKALAIAERALDFGPEASRRDYVKTLLASATRLGAINADREIEVARAELLQAFSSMSDVGNKQPVYDAASHALPETTSRPADDQDGA